MPNAIDAFIEGQEKLKAAQAAHATAQAQAQQRKVEEPAPTLMGAVEDVLGNAADIVSSVVDVDTIKSKLQGTGSFFHRLADNLAERGANLHAKAADIADNAGDHISSLGESVGEVITDAGAAVIDGAGSVVEGAASVAGAVADAIAD
jgi:hypothetical protein